MLNEADATFIWVSAKDFWQMGSYGAFAGAFSLARELAPSVICFEDVDNWIDSYTVDLIKGEMDGLQQSTGVTTLLTTNFPDQLPAALIDRPGRFHDVLEINLPSKDVRLRMLQKWAMCGQDGGATLDSLAKMADDTNGYSGAHIYELCHFAKTIRDEDECSLDDALTKAFAKVKEQRDLINQNQLSGSSYRPGRRELEAAMSKGWKGRKLLSVEDLKTIADGGISAGVIGPVPFDGEAQDAFMRRCQIDSLMVDNYPTESDREAACRVNFGKRAASPATKETGECKECGDMRKLNDDGYCEKCAAAPKHILPVTKAGRVLSQANYDMLSDACDDMRESMQQEMGRPAKALVKSAYGKVRQVCDSQPQDMEEQPLEGMVADHVMARAIEEADKDVAFRDLLRKRLDLLDETDELEQISIDFRRLTSTG
jgi:hypothetical protein